jgi:hypothetical protein
MFPPGKPKPVKTETKQKAQQIPMNPKRSAVTFVLIFSVLLSACSAGGEVGLDGDLDTGPGTGGSGR